MASISKRENGTYSVIYYAMIDGKKKQMWETFATHKEAKARKAEVENEINDGTFIPPSKQTIADFINDFVSLYGEEKWSLSTYSANISLIDNYINPLIGYEHIQTFTVKSADEFIKKLRKTPPVCTKYRKPKGETVGPAVIENSYKLLRCAFGQAVRWEIIKRNPFELVTKPKLTYKTREIWDAGTIRKALDECRDSKLYVSINLSFACSLRIGEILGLTWDNIHISDEDIANDNAHLYIEKELQRASMRAIETLEEKDIIKIFPAFKVDAKTRLILKTPKTESSNRRVWIPKTLAYILREFKQTQETMKEMLGCEYYDYNLAVPLPNGRPCEERVLTESFQRLREECELPNVVFHSLRHSSTTYKLKLNKGDIKATQGDTGHSQADMVTKVYAHILDEDRKVNAVKMENAFYSEYANPDLRGVKAPSSNDNSFDINIFIEKLKDASPEKLALLAELMKKE